MEHEETGCEAPPEGPILCVNNCGFFGSSANMNLCSKCYEDLILKEEQAKLATSSIESIVNGSPSGGEKKSPSSDNANAHIDSMELSAKTASSSEVSSSLVAAEPKAKEGPKRCSTCKKRVGLTGFNCRCGNIYCGTHRYSEKHECTFDYRTAGQDAIAKANPVVKAEKLDKI